MVVAEFHTPADRRRIDALLPGHELFGAAVYSARLGVVKYVRADLLGAAAAGRSLAETGSPPVPAVEAPPKGAVARPRVLFASYHCHYDPASGAALCTRDLFDLLTARGWACAVVTGPQLDDPAAAPIGAVLGAGPGADRVAGRCGDLTFTVFDAAPDGYPVTVFAPDPPAVHRAPGPAETAAFHDVVAKVAADFKPDVVLTYGGDPASRAALVAARAAGAAAVFWLHNRAYTDAAMFRAFDAVVVPSADARDDYRDRLGLNSVVLPGPWAWDRFRCDPAGAPHVTFVNPEPAKGVFWFARLADVLGRARPDIPFLVVEGRGRAGWLDRSGVDLRGVVSVRTMPNTPDPRRFYRMSKVVLMPSLWLEGLPRVAVEAMANGIPVVGSGRGGLAEVLAAGGVRADIPAAFTADTRVPPPAEAVGEWAAAVVRLWDDPAAYARASAAARAAAVKQWHPDVVLPEWEAFLVDIAARAATNVGNFVQRN